MKLLLLALSLLSVANALCPGDSPCSGHGTCGTDDKCTCYRDYTGIDCKSRRCPYTISWSDMGAHSYAECGDKGTCDTKTGQCKCFDGFTGRGCDRMACPSNCNNRGTCELFSSVNSGYTGWDSSKIQVCNCDPGFEGPACENRICPKGNDPITAYTSAGVAEVDDVMEILFTTGSATTGEVVLTYADHEGNMWKTRAIDVATASELTIQEALMAIPNSAIPDVTCSDNGGTAGAGNQSWLCTFSHSLMGGVHSSRFTLSTTACTAHGCQPKSLGSSQAFSINSNQAGTSEHVKCSNRGTCDADTGSCKCVKGYTGEACQIQTIIT